MQGFTPEEFFLSRLGTGSFLRFWSWSNLFRDQGKKTETADGKEICDLTVFFGNDIILFSDKRIEFNEDIEIRTAWSRWARRAIQASLKQLEGARRWIQQHPERIFLDKACKSPLPLTLPPSSSIEFHFVIVCHGIERVILENSGDPSFIFDTSLRQDAQWMKETCVPFTIGRLSSGCFVHVFNEATVHLVLKEFDTVKDFLNYLKQRERLLDQDKTIWVKTEADIIHLYYLELDEANQSHSISLGESLEADAAYIDMGGIEALYNDPEYIAKNHANSISYFWDELIENFSHHVLNGTSLHKNWESPGEAEPSLRAMAEVGRLERRYLSQAYIEFYENTPPNHRATRIVHDVFDNEKLYVFLLLSYSSKLGSMEEYRHLRMTMLGHYVLIYRLRNPNIRRIVAIGALTRRANAKLDRTSFFNEGQDFGYFSDSVWNEEMRSQAQALELQYTQGKLITDQTRSERHITEFPKVSRRTVKSSREIPMRSSERNSPCPCGSGRKFKHCCGLPA